MNIFIKLSLFSVIYVLILIIISPLIDHMFSSLDKDKHRKENNLQILVEVLTHIVLLIIIWYIFHNFLKNLLQSMFKVKVDEHTQTAIDLVSAITLVGLQKNLINKLEYITLEHPFRLLDMS